MKVFCTVGSQLPFDRLIQSVVTFAQAQPEIEVFYQLGRGSKFSSAADSCETLNAEEYAEKIGWSDIMVSHAGMGTILTALTNDKPILVMPRDASLGEHRNDHQLHTASRLQEASLIHVAAEEQELARFLANIDQLTARRTIGPLASSRLVDRVQKFVDTSG